MRLDLNFCRSIYWGALLTFFMLLSGCATVQTRDDGPPPFEVDETKIPNAVPKSEKRAKYGNMSVYRVYGKSYRVMHSAKNFQETGMASWYGRKFHKLRTSSGEHYDMLAMTAAHRTLPLPTYIEVTNTSNGRKVIVKVNDRGPFASNRILDLSYVAAKKLGMVGHGTARVNIKAIDPAEAFGIYADNHTVSHGHSKPEMYLQVGAFKNRLYAEKLQKRLSPVVTSPIAITAKKSKHLYHIQIGPIKDMAAATSIKKKLRSIGLTPQHIKV